MMNQDKQLDEIIRLSDELNSIQDIDLLLEKILLGARTLLNSDAGSIQIKEGNELVFRHVQTDSIERKLPPGEKLIYKSFKTKINRNSISGYVALTGDILNIHDVYNIPGETPYKFDPTNDKVSGYKTKSMLTIPLMNNRREILGVMQIVNALRSKACREEDEVCTFAGSFDEHDEQLARHFANSASMILQRAQMTRDLILRMISMAELRDPKETGPHVNRVAALAIEIYEKWALRNNISQSEIDHNKDTFRMSAMLHDVGKVGISDLILKKPGKLTPGEYEIMKTHSQIGGKLFRQMHSEFDDMASVIALNHHENWDGTGYPGHVDVITGEPLKTGTDGNALPKRGEEIPIYGRIVALADVYDALSCRRVYKDPWPEEKVVEEIRRESGKKFDPQLVDIFFEYYNYFKSIAHRYPDDE